MHAMTGGGMTADMLFLLQTHDDLNFFADAHSTRPGIKSMLFASSTGRSGEITQSGRRLLPKIVAVPACAASDWLNRV